MASTYPTRFRAGAVVGRSLGILARNIVIFGLLGLLSVAPVAVFQLYLVQSSLQEGLLSVPSFLTFALYFVTGWILNVFLTAAITYRTIAELRRTRSDFSYVLGEAKGLILPVMGVAFATALILLVAMMVFGLPGMLLVQTGGAGVLLGAILILVPLAILWLMLAVAVPVCVVERPGIWASLARSRALTAGHRWKILGAMVLIGIIVSLVSLLAGIVSGGAGAMGALAVQFVLTALMGVWISVAVAVIYHDLRLLKEGGGPTGSVAPPV